MSGLHVNVLMCECAESAFWWNTLLNPTKLSYKTNLVVICIIFLTLILPLSFFFYSKHIHSRSNLTNLTFSPLDQCTYLVQSLSQLSWWMLLYKCSIHLTNQTHSCRHLTFFWTICSIPSSSDIWLILSTPKGYYYFVLHLKWTRLLLLRKTFTLNHHDSGQDKAIIGRKNERFKCVSQNSPMLINMTFYSYALHIRLPAPAESLIDSPMPVLS